LDFSPEQKNIAKRLQSYASVYQNVFIGSECFKTQFQNNNTANYTALECFLGTYAYERQGRPKAYPAIAKLTLKAVFKERLETLQLTQTSATLAWERYEQIAAEKFRLERNKLNWRRNPMSSDGGVLTKMANAENKGVLNIANYVKALIVAKKTSDAHSFIDSIRGVGPKIASFYLRDVAFLGGIDESQIEEPFYLQPLDTWLNQALSIIKKETVNTATNKERRKAQQMIVDLCKQADCSPIAFNQGAWFAGSQIAGEYDKFKSLADGEFTVLDDYLSNQRKCISEIEKVRDKISKISQRN
jgi:hypothetical protein